MTPEKQKEISNWHSQTLDGVLKQLRVNPAIGLPQKEILERREAWGKNVLPKGKKTTAIQMFFRQFTSPLVYILLVAVLLTWWIREYADMFVILLVVIGNASIGLFQEYRASKIFEKLKSLVRVEALVIRDGKLTSADSEELVPGDIIVLRGGNKVPADARLIDTNNLEADEAILTGESKPTKKFPSVAPPKALVGDRPNMIFMGTMLEGGEGRAAVVATGARTEIGQISLLAQETHEEASPLQQRMGKLAKFLTEVFVIIAAAIFLIGLVEGDPLIEMFKTTIAVAVAAIPEGLPAVISIILAVSSKKILERKGLVMKLIAAETLGSTSVICADKTGTLTYGQMKVEEVLSDSPQEALIAMALANEAVIEEKENGSVIRGEATDKAKLEKFLANEEGKLQKLLEQKPRLGIIPFDSERKYIASFHKNLRQLEIYLSGAPETILEKCRLSKIQKIEIKKNYESFANRGYRLIALAKKQIPVPKTQFNVNSLDSDIKELTYLGLATIRDPIREDVKEALRVTRRAGIKVLMITGDHILTAKSIGLELGFGISGSAVMTGNDLDQMTDQQIRAQIGKFEIVARATPVHKMRIIAAWQKLGAVVAMTGDGVNDAPALKAADIGVAVGSGTDVSKEASDLILLNDSFSTITAAVREGRTGFANIRKATVVVMSNALTEIVLITSSLILGTPFPITAIQILWVNIVEDGLPVLSLAFEPAEPGIMERNPISPQEPILDRESKFIIFVVGIISDLLLVGIFMYLFKNFGWDLIKIQSFIFIATATPTLLNVFAFKSLREPITRIKLFNNHFLLVSVAVGFGLMLVAIYVPFLNHFLKTVALPFWPALISFLLFPLVKLTLVEFTKWRYRIHQTKG